MLFSHSPSKHSILLLFPLFTCNLLAQDFDLFKFQTAYYPKQSILESGVDGEIGCFEWGVQLAIPQSLNENKKTLFIHKFGYNQLKIDIEANSTAEVLEGERFYHVVYYNLGLVQSLNPNWRLVVNISPTISSDFGDYLSEDDLLFQANAMAVNTKNEKLKYGFGFSYATRFGRQLFLPLGLFKYQSRKIELDIILPYKLNVMLKTPNNRFLYGLKAGLNGGVFHNTRVVQTVNNLIEEVGYSRMVVGPAFTLRMKDALNFHVQGGIAVGRRLEFVDFNEDITDRTPQPTPFFGLGISFAPKTKNPEAGLNND